MQPADAGDLRGRVPGLLPDAAGGSGERGHSGTSSRTPPPTTSDDYPTPSPWPEPGVHSSPQTRSDLLPARPDYNGNERYEVKCRNQNFQLSTLFQRKHEVKSNLSKAIKIQIKLFSTSRPIHVLISKFNVSKKGSMTPCPGTTTFRCCSTRTRLWTSSTSSRRTSR